MWEYTTVLLGETMIDGKMQYAKTIDGQQIRGLSKILNHYGSNNWELVSFVADRWYDFGHQEGGAVQHYRAVFKRPKR